VETASKLALQYWREKGRPDKTELISRHTSYHRLHQWVRCRCRAIPCDGARGATSVRPYPRVAAPSCYRCPFDLAFPSASWLAPTTSSEHFREVGPDRVASVVVEPIVGAAGGAINPPDGYYERVAEICRANDVLLIADRGVDGSTSHRPFLALSHWGVTADLVALGKGLAAGYTPLSAVLISDRVADTITSGSGSSCTVTPTPPTTFGSDRIGGPPLVAKPTASSSECRLLATTSAARSARWSTSPRRR